MTSFLHRRLLTCLRAGVIVMVEFEKNQSQSCADSAAAARAGRYGERMVGKKDKDNYQSLADALAEETLAEAADHFFGERKSIEEALGLYQEKVNQLRELHLKVETSQANLHFLLLRGESDTVTSFYRQIGVDPELVPQPDIESSADLKQLQLPLGLGAKSRFAKLVCRAYAAFVAEANDYMNGRYYDDPEDPRRKRITLNYNQLADYCQEVNERIDKANQYNTPTQVLQFFKQLDIERSEKEAQIGVPMHYSLDQEMAFTPEDFSCALLESYPDFPPLYRIEGPIKSYSAQVFSSAPDEIRSILEMVKKA